jgi:hypothetical protein
MPKNKILLIPEKSDPERESVLQTWIKSGGKGKKVNRFWEKPSPFENKKVALYGNDTFVLVLAQILDRTLISPDDSLIARLDMKWTKRKVVQQQMNDLSDKNFPCFIKPFVPKQFSAKIYQTEDELRIETRGMNSNEKILVSEIVKVKAEARAFVLDNEIKDISIYEGDGNVEEAKLFLVDFLKENVQHLPKTYVIDIGCNEESGWFVVEFNSSWGAGLNNCNPEKVIACIMAATI